LDTELLKKRFLELAERSYEKGIYTSTDFLSMDEVAVFAAVKKLIGHVPYTLFGGTDGCERQMLRFGSPDLCGYDEAMPIRCLKAVPRSQKFAEKLTHRDFLGALLGLGIDRSAIGDIIVKENAAYIFCTEGMAVYLAENYKEVRHTPILCSISAEVPPDAQPTLRDCIIQVASERFDAIVAHVWHLSRGASAELFERELVFVNGAICNSASRKPNDGDIVSVRRVGRFRYNGAVGTSKKGKLNVSVSLYE